MNIFILDSNLKKAAQDLCDKHIVKMPLETAQMLQTALSAHKSVTYKPTHKNHPCSLWVSSSRENFTWAALHGLEMCAEYTKRYGRVHKVESVIYDSLNYAYYIQNGELSVPPKAMPEEVKIGQNTWEDVIASYRNYYLTHKLIFAKWNYSEKPLWLSHSTGLFYKTI
jgi:hypothetical protein